VACVVLLIGTVNSIPSFPKVASILNRFVKCATKSMKAWLLCLTLTYHISVRKFSNYVLYALQNYINFVAFGGVVVIVLAIGLKVRGF
jgi:hypothetical protein